MMEKVFQYLNDLLYDTDGAQWSDLCDEFLLYGVPAILAIVAGCLAVWLVILIRQWILRVKVGRRYGVTVPENIHISRSGDIARPGSLSLAWPEWRTAKKDGTRDRRTNDRRIIRNKSWLLIDGWEMWSKDPESLYGLAVDLRAAHADIMPCAEEERKMRIMQQRLELQQAADGADDIINRFQDEPTRFEEYCAGLFRAYGYTATVTPPARDGGYDIFLERGGMTWIVECKLYGRGHRVGRPVLQKLYGANSGIGADGMIVVTTSGYSADALAYASDTGIETIDGDRLVDMCRAAWGTRRPQAILPAAMATLTRSELRSGYPADMR